MVEMGVGVGVGRLTSDCLQWEQVIEYVNGTDIDVSEYIRKELFVFI